MTDETKSAETTLSRFGRKNARQKIVTDWRDIPSMVTIKRRRDNDNVILAPRFQIAIDRAAMRAGKGSSDL